jgi:methylated-DNA-protein-cysteine methyltransferase-like protein
VVDRRTLPPPAPGPDSFPAAVDRVLRALGSGEVVTYGEVAAEAGWPGAARAVGRLLASSDEAYPWWRVVTASGRLVPGHEDEHERLLRSEGVAVSGGRVRRPR